MHDPLDDGGYLLRRPPQAAEAPLEPAGRPPLIAPLRLVLVHVGHGPPGHAAVHGPEGILAHLGRGRAGSHVLVLLALLLL